MPYMPINCFPRNVTLEKQIEEYAFLANVDNHNQIINVLLNFYNDDGTLIFQGNNNTKEIRGVDEKGQIITGTNSFIRYFKSNSTEPPYNINNQTIDLRVKPELTEKVDDQTKYSCKLNAIYIQEDKNINNVFCIALIFDIDFIYNDVTYNYKIKALFSQRTIGESHYDAPRQYIPYSILYSLNNQSYIETDKLFSITLNINESIFTPDKPGYSIGDVDIKNIDIALNIKGLKINDDVTLYTYISKHYTGTPYVFQLYRERNDYSMSRSFKQENLEEILPVHLPNTVTSDQKWITFWNSKSSKKWNLTLVGSNYDTYILDGKIDDYNENYLTVSGFGLEFLKNNQQMNNKYYITIKPGTEYFNYLEVLPVVQTAQSNGYKYEITFPNKISTLIPTFSIYEKSSYTLALGTYTIAGSKLTISDNIISFTDQKGYLITETELSYSTHVAVNFFNEKSQISLRDNKGTAITFDNTWMDLPFTIYSNEITSNLNSFFIENKVQIAPIFSWTNKLITINSNPSDILLNWYQVVIMDIEHKIVFKSDKIFMPYINFTYHLLDENKSYIINLDLEYYNKIRDTYEYDIEPRIEYEYIDLNGSLDINNSSINITSHNNFNIGAYQIRIYQSNELSVQTDKINSNSIEYSVNLDTGKYEISLSLWNKLDTLIGTNIYSIDTNIPNQINLHKNKTVYNNSKENIEVTIPDIIFLKETVSNKEIVSKEGTTTNEKTYTLDYYDSYISVYKQEYDLNGNYIKQTLLLDSLYKSGDFVFIDYGIASNRIYQYDILYHQIGTYKHDDGSSLEIDNYFLSRSNSVIVDDWISAAVFGVKTNLENNLYELDPNNIWYFNLDMQADAIDFVNERSIFTNLSPIPKVGVSNTNYMSQTFTSKLGYLNEDDMYVGDSGEKLNKFAAWANDGTVKVMRLPNGYLIPVDIQLKTNTTNYAVCGEPSDISFTWTQVGDHTTTSLYSIR